jgi:glycosyltransferase involved in cell wall biosynthesis
MPRVSVCLPNLNGQPFLTERLESILKQTFWDWELIVVDGFSDDGSWELLRDQAADEPRMRLSQAPREGVLAGINACIRQARGEYVYIATSDDTMESDCLEKMVAALDAHAECGICHCCLRIINAAGEDVAPHLQWSRYRSSEYFGELMNVPHIRLAPHDGLLHFALYTVYTSLTQLLIRRSVFKHVGIFDVQFGPPGDFEWDMRASLLTNTFHVPETLATWRIHAGQATTDLDTSQRRLALQRMARVALRRARKVAPDRLRKVPIRRLEYAYDRDYVWWGLLERQSWKAQRFFLLRQCLVRPRVVLEYIRKRRTGQPFERGDKVGWIRQELRRLEVKGPVPVAAG